MTRGYTLLELVIGVAAFGVVSLAAFGVFTSAPRQTALFVHQTESATRHRSARERIAEVLRYASRDHVELVITCEALPTTEQLTLPALVSTSLELVESLSDLPVDSDEYQQQGGSYEIQVLHEHPVLRFAQLQIDPETGTSSLSGTYTLGVMRAAGELLNGLDDNSDGVRDEGILYLQHPSGKVEELLGNVLPGSFQVDPPLPGNAHLTVSYQTAVRYDARAAALALVLDESGRYAEQPGYVVTSVASIIWLGN